MKLTPRNRILIVTPTLGDSPFLDETVASIAAQSPEIVHVIAAPAPRVEPLQRRFPHVQVCRDAGRAGGVYGALNAGLAAAAGDWEWFTYINDDDVLLPGFSAMFARETGPRRGSDVLYGDVELIDESGRTISCITTEHSPRWMPALLQQGISPLMQQGTLFRRPVVERLGGFDSRYRLCADLDFWLRALTSGARFRAHRLRVAQFRLRRGQLSSNTATTEREQAEIVARLLPHAASPLVRHVARWRYRWCNLPRYLARLRSVGFRTSYEVLQTEGVQQ
jgi:glycosyltransferase